MPVRVVALAGCAALLAFSFVGLIGNSALASAQGAAAANDWKSAETHARRAVSWAPWSSSALDVLGTAQSALGRQASAYRTLRKAVNKDSNNWSLWYDLGDTAPTTAASRRAYNHAARLNPLSPSIAMLRDLGILPHRRGN
jgi:tetratricopeptide (TPR) repeat protein